ncbi:hypothetical protein GM658_24510 [Pseudoduganella eburnea]|uniref:Lipoprotein n=1 Tax=Massilia eburnea TaxID=1776165 RepID=A0A6L6QN48_9BURK|nr:hypothetical protein [Massilia eburnea]MTW13779.1 hypothetical protein [Massilia eburnea]
MNIRKLALALFFIAQGTHASEGFVRTGESGNLFLYTTAENILGKSVVYQFDDGKAVRCCATAVVGEQAALEENEFLSDEFSMKDVHKYALKAAPPKSDWLPFVGIAVIAATESPKSRGTGLDVKEMAGTSSIRTCISSEGIHLIKRTKGKLRSHLYMGLGYEVEPTCTAKDLQ